MAVENFTIEMISSSEQTNQDILMAMLGNSSSNHEGLYEFLHHIYYGELLIANDSFAALEKLLDNKAPISTHAQGACLEGARSILVTFFNELARVYTQQLLVREDLPPLETAAVHELDGVRYGKKVSAAFFMVAAATSAAAAAANAYLKQPAVAAAAAAASVVFGALGKWMDSLLKRRESGVKKRKEIIWVMIMGARIAITELGTIHDLARRLESDVKSMSVLMAGGGDVGREMAALGKSFRDLREQTNAYSMTWVKEAVLQRIISM